jgi:hypothetical protein
MRKKVTYLLCAALTYTTGAQAATDITTPIVSGAWTLAGSPYKIYNDVLVPLNDLLTIHPGVEVIFMGNYSFTVEGLLNAGGTPEQMIVFRANDTLNWSNFSVEDGGWGGISTNYFIATDKPKFEYCIIKDIKSLAGQAFYANYNEVVINNCIFHHNYAAGGIITASSNVNTSNTKLRFANNQVYDNHGSFIMSTMFHDSSIVKDNKFNNNHSKYGVFKQFNFDDNSAHVLLFDNNEVSDNVVSDYAPVIETNRGGKIIFSKNKIVFNSSTLGAAVSIKSLEALVDRNLIANNDRVQKNNLLLGPDDGGAALHLMGESNTNNAPGANVYNISNNIIANNFSDVNGAGIWARDCKVNIVNNTIINNLSVDPGAAIYADGTTSRITIHNNIIHGNRMEISDTGRNVFKFGSQTQFVRVTDNFIDYRYNNPPANIVGLDSNSYHPTIVLANNTQGAGHHFDATVIDFSPIAQSAHIINQGNSAHTGFGTLDYNGNPRIVSTGIDRGAIESSFETNIREVNYGDYISLYPLPCRGSVWLHNTSNSAIRSIQLYQVDGRVAACSSAKVGDKHIVSFPSLAAGAYFLNVQYENGNCAVKPLINRP